MLRPDQKPCDCITQAGRRCRYRGRVWQKHFGRWYLICSYHENEYRRGRGFAAARGTGTEIAPFS